MSIQLKKAAAFALRTAACEKNECKNLHLFEREREREMILPYFFHAANTLFALIVWGYKMAALGLEK